MCECKDDSTIRELAEVIADYSSELREARAALEQAEGDIADLEIKAEDQEKSHADFYIGLMGLIKSRPTITVEHFAVTAEFLDLITKHFGDVL